MSSPDEVLKRFFLYKESGSQLKVTCLEDKVIVHSPWGALIEGTTLEEAFARFDMAVYQAIKKERDENSAKINSLIERNDELNPLLRDPD